MSSVGSVLVLIGAVALGGCTYEAESSGQRLSSEPEGPEVFLPQGNPIILDGTLEADEWRSAARVQMDRGGEVLLQGFGQEIHVGIRGMEPGFPHLILSARDSVWVIHASASLGSIVFIKEDTSWTLVRSPEWELYDPTTSLEAQDARERYLNQNGWVGSTAEMGQPGEAEFVIQPEAFGGPDLRMAAAFLPTSPPGNPKRWPFEAPDDVGLIQLMTGPMPETADFLPMSWARLVSVR